MRPWVSTPALCNWVLDFDGPPPGGEGRKHLHPADPQHWGPTRVERVVSFKFLGVHITDKLNWSTHTDSIVKKAQQEAEEIRLVTKSIHKLLQMHNREHPVGLYHRLVRQMLRPQP